MKVTELNREQLIQLKQRWLIQKADDGEYAEVMDVDYDEPSYGDLANADELVADSTVFEYWEGVEFVEEDFV